MKFSAAYVSAAGLISQAEAHGRFLVSQPNGMMALEVDMEAPPNWAAQCQELMRQCKEDEQDLTDDYNRNLKALEEEYLRQKRILEDKEATHKDEVADVKAQKKVVKKEKLDVKEARKVVQENAHCPPELERAELELSKQMGIPNDNDEAIDAECKAKKDVLKAKACVEELRKAQRVLDEEEGEHSAEKGELNGEEGEADDAADALPPQEKRVADALAAWEAAKKRGPPSRTVATDNCEDKKDALMREADDHIKALEDEYRRQKRILDGKEATHEEEQYHVADQERVVYEEKQHVKEAQWAVKEKDHCPPELVKAKEELAKQQAIPNDTPEAVEAECAATKAVLRLQKCVDELREAELVLAKEKDEHGDSKEDLSGEEAEAADAKAALPPQEQKVADALAALEAARRARDALAECGVEGKKKAPAPAPKPAESGAVSVSISASAAAALFAATAITV